MLKRHDRYVNNELLGFISRPQYENSCSISALTAVFNYLFSEKIGIKTSDELAKIAANKHAIDITGAGNKTVMDWFDKLCQHFNVKGKCRYYLRSQDVEDWGRNAKLISDFKQEIRSNDSSLIYHMENHYTIMVGYFEHSNKPDDAYDNDANLQRWIVLGEHSDYNPLPKLVQRSLQLLLSEEWYNLVMESIGRTPIWTRRWKSIRHDLTKSPNHCVMIFEREE